MGLFWAIIKNDYPHCEQQPPLPREEEPEDIRKPTRPLMRFFTKPPIPRQWFVSADRSEILQLQADRFCVNWRTVGPGSRYPRYEHLRNQFQRRWTQFVAFAQAQGSPPTPDLCEMTYVNDIPRNQGWSHPSEIGAIFPAVSFNARPGFLPRPASLGFEVIFEIDGQHGRLRVSCGHARKTEPEEQEVFRLNIMARGKPKETDPDGLLTWFKNAREWIVRGFTDMTEPRIQKEIWKRVQ